jgi:hypothetical protein
MGQKGFWDEQERREKLHSPCSSGLMNISTGKISAPYEKPYMTAMPVGNPPM